MFDIYAASNPTVMPWIIRQNAKKKQQKLRILKENSLLCVVRLLANTTRRWQSVCVCVRYSCWLNECDVNNNSSSGSGKVNCLHARVLSMSVCVVYSIFTSFEQQQQQRRRPTKLSMETFPRQTQNRPMRTWTEDWIEKNILEIIGWVCGSGRQCVTAAAHMSKTNENQIWMTWSRRDGFETRRDLVTIMMSRFSAFDVAIWDWLRERHGFGHPKKSTVTCSCAPAHMTKP